jgi:uncharacterized protein involved in exopolysaccharide biosynthesis
MEQPNSKNPQGEAELSVRDILAPLFCHKRLVILVFCGVFLCSMIVAWAWAARYYVSTMQVLVEVDRSDPTITAAQNAAVMNNKGVTTDQVSSEVALLRGQDMLRSAAATCGLNRGWSLSDILYPFLTSDPEARNAMKLEKASIRLARALTVESETTSDVINVKYGNTAGPKSPACVLETLKSLYLEKHVQLERPAGSSDFFAGETEKSRIALTEAESRLTNFGRLEGVADPVDLRTDMAQEVANSEGALSTATEAVAADQQRIKNLKEQLEATPERSITVENSDSANLLLQGLQSSLLAAQIKRTQLLLKYDSTYPLVREADQEISETETAITKAQDMKYVNRASNIDTTHELLRQELAKAQADLVAQKATVSAVASDIHRMRTEMVDLDGKAVKQGALLRDAKANESTYLLYLNKREQERTSDALDKKGIANVAIAVAPTVPALPAHSPLTIMALGFLAAMVAGIGSGFIGDYFDPSFRTPDDVMETLRMPVLASMPKRAA